MIIIWWTRISFVQSGECIGVRTLMVVRTCAGMERRLLSNVSKPSRRSVKVRY